MIPPSKYSVSFENNKNAGKATATITFDSDFGNVVKKATFKILPKKITKAKISYEYIYNFDTKTNDCIITFTTDKTQNKIISASYNSKKCHYIFR